MEQGYDVVIPQIPQNGSLTYFDLGDFIRLLIRPDEKLEFVNVADVVRHLKTSAFAIVFTDI